MNIPQAVWFELIKGMPAAFVALVIGLFAGWIAWNQYKVARAKFRLDLFEQRYEVYDAIWTYLLLIGNDDDAERQARVEMQNANPRAYFLYGGAIGRYFDEVIKKGSELKHEHRRLRSANSTEDRSICQRNATEIEEWLRHERENLRERFSPYLGFQKWH